MSNELNEEGVKKTEEQSQKTGLQKEVGAQKEGPVTIPHDGDVENKVAKEQNPTLPRHRIHR